MNLYPRVKNLWFPQLMWEYLRASTSDEDKYCMLDSGANVMVVPLKEGMRGDTNHVLTC